MRDIPGLDGLEVVKRIRAGQTFADLKDVAVTRFAMDRDREKDMAAGFTAYLTKCQSALISGNRNGSACAFEAVFSASPRTKAL